MWLPGLHKVVRWRIGRLRRRGASPEKRLGVAASYARLRRRDPNAWVLWGNMLIRHRRFAEAERALRQGLILHPTSDPDIGWLLARSLTNQSRFEEAREVLAEQVRVFPDSRLPWLGLAEVALRERRWDEGKGFIAESLARTSPTDVGGKYEAAILLSPIPGERARAIQLIEEAMEGGLPDHAGSHLLLGALLELEEDEDARRHLDQAEALWDGPGDFLEDLSRTRHVLSDPHAAFDETSTGA